MKYGIGAALSAALMTTLHAQSGSSAERYWPQRRGPYPTGVSRTQWGTWSSSSATTDCEHVYARDTPYVPSPLLYDGIVYFVKTNSGLLSAYDAKTGQPHYTLQRLGVPNVFASPVGAKGRVYLTGQEGTTLVIKHGPSCEVLAKNTLDDGFNASPALMDGEMYLRGFRNLYSIGSR